MSDDNPFADRDDELAKLGGDLQLVGSDRVDDAPETMDEAIRAMFEEAASRDQLVRAQAVEWAANCSSYTKGDLKTYMKEAAADRAAEDIDLHAAEKVVSEDPDRDPVWRWTFSYDGETYAAEMDAAQLLSPSSFAEVMLNVTDEVPYLGSTSEWRSTVDELLADVEVVEVAEDTGGPEHAAAEDLVESVAHCDVTTDYGAWRERPTVHVYYDGDTDEVLVADKLVVEALDGHETSRRAIREVLGNRGYVDGNSKTVRESDGDAFFRAWRFQPGTLIDEGVFGAGAFEADPDDTDDGSLGGDA